MKITFKKRGVVYCPDGNFPWGKTHAQVPFPLQLEAGKIRIFFSTRDALSRSGVSFVDVDENDPSKVVYVHDQLCFHYGAPGFFDDSGTMPSWFLRQGDKIILYYTGWNRSDTASYRLSIGMAVSEDKGLTFERKFTGPVLDRGPFDAIWVGQPCVLFENGIWKMWYLSCEKVERIHDHPEPFYNVKYATSQDGISWQRDNTICIPFDANTDAVGRPFVFKRGEMYFMLHSNRKADGYRTKAAAGYRIEISSSRDGLSWERIEDFHFGKEADGWNSIMTEYASLFPAGENKYWMFYNGNGFGGTGFGLAELIFE